MSDSDDPESDLDYVPSDGEAVSEEEESGDHESWVKKEDSPEKIPEGLKRKRTKTKAQPSKSRKRKGGIRLEEEPPQPTDVLDTENERLKEKIVEEEKQTVVEKEKKRTDDLWSSFLSDVGQRPKKGEVKSPVDTSQSQKEKKRTDDLWSSFLSDVGQRPKKGEVKSPVDTSQSQQAQKQTVVEKGKKRTDDLWSSFLSDVGQRPKKGEVKSPLATSQSQQAQSESSKSTELITKVTKPPDKLTVTKTYNFAGENIEVTEKVDANSKAGREELKKQEVNVTPSNKPSSDTLPESTQEKPSLGGSPISSGPARAGGLSGVLGKLNKANKISCLSFSPSLSISEQPTPNSTGTGAATISPPSIPVSSSHVTLPAPSGSHMTSSGVDHSLTKNDGFRLKATDKSKMDWDVFKKKEGIDEELQTFNKGKHGYVERLDFLGRTDQRQFEIERNLRQVTRKH